MEHYLEIEGEKVPFQLRTSQKAKRIKIVVDLRGIQVIKTPLSTQHEVYMFLTSKSKWVYKHYHKFKEIREGKKERQFVSGERILYLGEWYQLEILMHAKNAVRINFLNTHFEMIIHPTFQEKENLYILQNALKKWYVHASHDYISKRLTDYCRLTNQTFHQFRVKEQKTRWGSCSKKKNLNFNWKLLMSPQFVVDYVILHEVCHLKYMNHSKDFWSMVERYMPEYKKAERWLKENGSSIIMS
jgi:predicted metal-dependent hydrolase